MAKLVKLLLIVCATHLMKLSLTAFAPTFLCSKCSCATRSSVKAVSTSIIWRKNWRPDRSLGHPRLSNKAAAKVDLLVFKGSTSPLPPGSNPSAVLQPIHHLFCRESHALASITNQHPTRPSQQT